MENTPSPNADPSALAAPAATGDMDILSMFDALEPDARPYVPPRVSRTTAAIKARHGANMSQMALREKYFPRARRTDIEQAYTGQGTSMIP